MNGWLIFALTAAVFAPTIGYDFQRAWDDGGMLLFNSNLVTWDWHFMFLSIYFGHWMPLTWLTWTADAHLWGAWAGGWHAGNVLLHAINAVLFYAIAIRLTGSRVAAVFAALVFAVHPLRIESVAWVTERKDVLMGAFFLGSILLWIDGRRVWSFVAFVAACLSKSPAVFLPVMLVLIEWYRHDECCGGRLPRGLVLPLAPFFLVAGMVAELAFYAVSVGVHNLLPYERVGLGPRLLQVAYSEVFYARQTIWPSRLSHMIEYTWVPSWGQAQYPIALAVVTLAVVACALTWRAYPAVTAAFVGYAVLVFPQAGLFQNGPQLVANRYSYLACLPLALLAGAGLAKASRRLPRLVPLGAAGVVVALAVVTSIHLPAWRNETTLWTSAAEAEPTCTMCQDWAGVIAYRNGDLQATRRYFLRAIVVSNDTIFPRYERWWGLGKILQELGEKDAAAEAFHTYLASIPEKYRYYANDVAHIQDAQTRLAQLQATH